MIQVFTDASCLGNPGPGTWSAIIVEGDERREFKGYVENSTSNRLELTGVIQALRRTPKGAEVQVNTDSQYVARGAAEWMKRWIAANWKSAEGTEIKNQDLWIEIAKLSAERRITWAWIRRETNPDHDAAHNLASLELAKRIKTMIWKPA